jgi:flagellar basal body rod protein FlgG
VQGRTAILFTRDGVFETSCKTPQLAGDRPGRLRARYGGRRISSEQASENIRVDAAGNIRSGGRTIAHSGSGTCNPDGLAAAGSKSFATGESSGPAASAVRYRHGFIETSTSTCREMTDLFSAQRALLSAQPRDHTATRCEN